MVKSVGFAQLMFAVGLALGAVAPVSAQFGAGSYTTLPPVDLAAAIANPQAVVGDWNADGFDDFVLYDGNASSFPITLHIFTSNGEMSYTKTGTDAVNVLPAPYAANYNGVAGEEFPSYPFLNAGQIAFSMFNGNGGGSFAQSIFTSTITGSQSDPRVFSGDIDGDGDTDLIASVDASTFTSFSNVGSGAFQADNFPYSAIGGFLVPQRQPARSRIANVYQETITDDFGNPIGVKNEIITAIYNAGQWSYESLLATSQTTGAIDIFPVIHLDVNGDGVQDLIAVDTTGVVAFLASATGQFSAASKISVSGLTGNILNAGDLDGDGDEDLIQFNQNQSMVMENRGGGQFSGFVSTLGGSAITGVGQFAGNARPDLYRLAPNGNSTRLTVARYGSGASSDLPVIVSHLIGSVPSGNPLALDKNSDSVLDSADAKRAAGR